MARAPGEQTRFAQLLDAALERKGMSQNEFLREVQVSKGTMAYLRYRPPPAAPDPEKVWEWARVLGLEGREAEEFVEESQLACSPILVRDLVARLRRRLGEE